MRLGALRARPGEVRIRFGTPVPTLGYADTDAREFADRLQGIAARTYAELAREEQKPVVA